MVSSAAAMQASRPIATITISAPRGMRVVLGADRARVSSPRATVLESGADSPRLAVWRSPRYGYRCGVPVKAVPANSNPVAVKTATVHGRSVNYVEGRLRPGAAADPRDGRDAPRTGQSVIEPLALRNTVDRRRLPRPRRARSRAAATTSLGSLASGLRDLLLTLGHERATLVGHSLGGGVAMQFTYQFPEMVERLVLVSSGGLGPEVSPVLRAAALPGADLFISPPPAPASWSARCSAAASGRSGCGPTPTSPRSPAATPRSPTPSAARPSSRPCARWSAPRGQRVAALDRLYLAEALPMLIVWGEQRPDHPGRPRRRGPPRAARQPPGGLPRRRPRARCWRPPAASSPCSSASSPPPSRPKFDRDEWVAHFKSA